MDPIVRVRDLGRRYLDGRATPAELAELQTLLQNSAAAADAFARLSRFEADLTALFAEEQGLREHTAVLDLIETTAARRQRRQRAVRLLALATSLLFVAVPAIWWLMRPVAPPEQPGPAPVSNILVGAIEVDGQA